MSAPHQAILDALCRRAQYDPSTILARLPGPDGEPVTVARMAGALAAGEPWAREWAEDVTGAAVRMVVGRGPSERVDLDAWRAEAGAALAMANAATPAPWTWDGLEQLVSGPAVVLYPCEVWHDTIEIQGTDADKAFTSAARTGWPRDAARVGVLADRCEALQAALSEALDEFEDAIQYKLDYLVTKHGDRETLARLRAIAAGGAPPKGESR